jgi:hypothetical protein
MKQNRQTEQMIIVISFSQDVKTEQISWTQGIEH